MMRISKNSGGTAMERDDDKAAKKKFNLIVGILVLLVVLWLNYDFLSRHMSSNNALIRDFSLKEEEMEKYKEPAVSGVFYSANPEVLNKELGRYLEVGYDLNERKPKMLVVPHAGYKYSAQVAAKAYAELLKYGEDIDTVVIVGPAHYEYVKGAALPAHDYFKTPLGNIPLDKQKISALMDNQLFKQDNKPFVKEHSIEVQLPFLQKVLKNFKIVPVVYGQVEPQQLADALSVFLDDEKTLLIFSADLSHYYKAEDAEVIDAHTARMIDLGNANLDKEMSCGAEGINAALILAKKMQMHAKLLDITHSGNITGDLDRVVGYGAWSFGEAPAAEKEKTPLEQEVENLKTFANIYGQDLLKIAGQSLWAAVNGERFGISRKDYPDVLFNKGASFVTLTKNGALRGCIGSLLPRQAIADDVAKNARKAATEDPRFKPVKPGELADLTVSISFLTDYEPINFKDEKDLLRQIVQGTDGVVLRDGNRQGLFLPSVWSEVKDKEEFLEELKLKAGMSPGYWSDKIRAYRFRTVEIKRDEN